MVKLGLVCRVTGKKPLVRGFQNVGWPLLLAICDVSEAVGLEQYMLSYQKKRLWLTQNPCVEFPAGGRLVHRAKHNNIGYAVDVACAADLMQLLKLCMHRFSDTTLVDAVQADLQRLITQVHASQDPDSCCTCMTDW